MKGPGFINIIPLPYTPLKKTEKALEVIQRHSKETSWPEGVVPMAPEHDGNEGFWPRGFATASVAAGIKYSGRTDLMVLLAEHDCTAAGVFTTNLCCAAPVHVSKKHLEMSSAAMRAIVCNSGNANAATGDQGMRDAISMAESAARAFAIPAESVIVSSTGVIGQTLPLDRVRAGISNLLPLCNTESGLLPAQAIMTTDTFPKFFFVDVILSGGTVRISGIAKGSGMICPNMATMLAFMATDASIEPALLQEALREANSHSFNAITVDGDTSTNDMAVILAGGTGPQVVKGSNDERLFKEALGALMEFLARLIVIDGEGASKLVTITVEGAENDHEATLAARTIAQSSLVKTALHGEDANWGRVIAAAGRSGARFHEEDLELFFNDLPVLRQNLNAEFSEEEAAEILAKQSYVITLKIGSGSGKATVWTCDLSKEYIEINGSYRS